MDKNGSTCLSLPRIFRPKRDRRANGLARPVATGHCRGPIVGNEPPRPAFGQPRPGRGVLPGGHRSATVGAKVCPDRLAGRHLRGTRAGCRHGKERPQEEQSVGGFSNFYLFCPEICILCIFPSVSLLIPSILVNLRTDSLPDKHRDTLAGSIGLPGHLLRAIRIK